VREHSILFLGVNYFKVKFKVKFKIRKFKNRQISITKEKSSKEFLNITQVPHALLNLAQSSVQIVS